MASLVPRTLRAPMLQFNLKVTLLKEMDMMAIDVNANGMKTEGCC